MAAGEQPDEEVGMRYAMWLIGLFLLSVICPAGAEVPRSQSDALVTDSSTSSLDKHELSAVGDIGASRDASQTRLAQVNVEEGRIERAEPSEDTSNTFQHLQIERVIEMAHEVNKRIVRAIVQLRVRQESFANATRLVRINEQRFRLGTAPAIEVLDAKAGAASRQGDLISARTTIREVEGLLKDLLELLDDDLLSSKSVPPMLGGIEPSVGNL